MQKRNRNISEFSVKFINSHEKEKEEGESQIEPIIVELIALIEADLIPSDLKSRKKSQTDFIPRVIFFHATPASATSFSFSESS